MGILAEKFKKSNEEYQAFFQEPVPDPATQAKEYFDYQKRRRAVERKHNHVRSVLKSYPFSLQQVVGALEKAMDREKLDRLKDSFQEMGFKIFQGNYVRKQRPELFESLSPEDKKRFNDSVNDRANFIATWRKEGKITQGEYDGVVARYLLAQGTNQIASDPEREALFVNTLDLNLSEGQRKAVVELMEEYRDPIDLEEQEKVTYPYEARANELLNQIPADIQADPVKLKQYQEALEFAKTHLTEAKPVVRQEGLAIDGDSQKIEAKQTEHIREFVRPVLEGGKYDNLLEGNEYQRKFLVVKEEKKDAYRELTQEGMKLSDRTKEGMRKLFEKMQEMGLEKYPYNATGEDGGKIYSFSKLSKQKEEFVAALEAGDPEKILQTKENYEKTWRDTEELYRISREYFQQDAGAFHGNMDSVRNEELPYEFTGDMRNTAYINSIYQAYMNIKTNKLSMEEFLENPIGGIMKDVGQKWQERSFAAVSSKAGTIEEAMDVMSSSGKYANSSNELRNVVSYGFGRQLSMPTYFETDPEIQVKSNMVADTLTNQVNLQVISKSEGGKFEYFSGGEKLTPLEEQARYATLGNLILAKDQDRKPNSMFVGCPETDVYGNKVGEGFDAESYLKQTPVDYEGVIKRAHRVQKHAAKLHERKGNMTWLSEMNALEATRQLYTKLLLAHPEDINKKGYKKLLQDLNSTLDRMAELDQGELGDRARENKLILKDMLEENHRNYLVQQDPVTELRRLEAEARKTGDFSKYASFLVDVETASAMGLPQEVDEAYGNYQDELLAINDKGDFAKGYKFYQNLCRAVNQIEFESGTIFSMKSEELAAKIRSGEIKVDPAFDDVRKDYHSSRTLANQMLEGSYEDRRVVGANGLGYLLNDKSPKYENGEPVYLKDKAQQQMEFYRDGKLAGNAAQRRRYLNDVQDGYAKKLGYENADGSMAPPHAYDIEQCLQKSIERAEKYCSDLEKLKLAAQEMLNAMNEARLGGREGSDQYKAMYDALEKVTRLSSDNTPSEVEQALDDVRSTAGDYKQKIDDLGIFAKFRQKGKDRYGFATGLEEFGRDKLIAFSGTSHLRLDLNEKVKDQLNRAKMNQLAYDAKQLKQVVQEKQPQEAALRQQAEREYLETVKAAEESLSGMGKGIKKPEGGLWEEKLDAFVKVATAKEIERRGGLKEGETILTVQRQLFGEKETRDAMTQMVKDYGGKKLIELAGKKEFGNLLKTYQEKRKTVNKEAPEKKANQLEKVEEPRKRSKSVTQKMDKHN